MAKGMSVSVSGTKGLEQKLQRMNQIRFDAVVEKQAIQMVDRQRPAITPPKAVRLTRPVKCCRVCSGPGAEAALKWDIPKNTPLMWSMAIAPETAVGFRDNISCKRT